MATDIMAKGRTEQYFLDCFHVIFVIFFDALFFF